MVLKSRNGYRTSTHFDKIYEERDVFTALGSLTSVYYLHAGRAAIKGQKI